MMKNQILRTLTQKLKVRSIDPADTPTGITIFIFDQKEYIDS